MDIETLLVIMLVPVDILMIAIVIWGVIAFKKTVDFDKMLRNQKSKKR